MPLEDQADPTLADLQIAGARARQAHAVLALAARRDPACFAQFVLRHERTGRRVRLAPMHLAWHDLLTRHDRVVLWSHVEAAKTSNVSIARVLWEVGKDPTVRVLILSNTHTQAARIASAHAAYIEHSAELHEVFPDMLPTERGVEPWKPLSGQLTVRRPTISKDATITAAGLHGNILGARYDLIILDDVLDFENTRTVESRRLTIDWLQATVQGRLTAQGRLWVVGTAWHPGNPAAGDPGDALHHYARSFSSDGVQRAFRYPVVDEAGRPRWPEVWPLDRIERRRRELSGSPVEFARQMLCEARDDSHARFKREYVDAALARGRDRTLTHALASLPPGCKTYTGVDLAVQRHAAADQTVLASILVHPNGDRELLDVLAGRWTGPEIVAKIVDAHRRYQSVVIVENNASQDFIVQFVRGSSAVPVKPYTTGAQKAHPEFGVESLATEMANGKWIFPCQGGASPELTALVNELLYYDPAKHTGDRLMALWFAREGVRLGGAQAQWARLDVMSRRFDLTDVKTLVESALHEGTDRRCEAFLGESLCPWRR